MADPIPPTGLRKVRLMQGWGLKAPATAIGLDANSLYRIESGRTKAPKLATRKKLAEVLKVAEADLFGR